MVRPFGGHTEEGLHNELRALEKICTLNNRNIVSVLSHGYLPQSIYYYIDMELCDLNLEEFIKKKWPTHVLGKSRYFTSAAYDSSIVWAIMEDLACGLAFIHSLREVHRDLKPRNGSSVDITTKLTLISSLLFTPGRLETSRFRCRFGGDIQRRLGDGILERDT